MMMRAISIAAMLALTANAALAEQLPVGFKEDARIKRYIYDENNVYKLNLNLKVVTALQFARGENIESILIGDSASWEVAKLKMGNVISLKPIIGEALTNMTVYTDVRVYTFELLSNGDMKAGLAAGKDQAFRIAFTYPAEFHAVDKDQENEGGINRSYMVSGDADFRPVLIEDNGRQTTFKLPKGAKRPAIFRVGDDRREQLVNSRTDGRRVIVDGVSDFWVMRIGDEEICVGKVGAIDQMQERSVHHDR